MNIRNMVSPLRKKQIKFTATLLLLAVGAGLILSFAVQTAIYSVSAKAVDYMFQDAEYHPSLEARADVQALKD